MAYNTFRGRHLSALALETLEQFRGVHDSEYEYQLHSRDIQLGADGSVVQDGDWVYVLNVPLDESVNQIDYFHGWYIAQMNDEYETDVLVTTMIPLYYRTVPGNLTKRIIAIQRIWRKTWAIKHHNEIMDLARFFVDLYARARREGIIIPSLDYEQKLAAREYSWTMKRHRADEREIAYQARLLARRIKEDCE